MTPLHILNFILLQWFFIRLAKVVDDDGVTIGWCIVRLWPLSGYWGRPFKYAGKAIHLQGGRT